MSSAQDQQAGKSVACMDPQTETGMTNEPKPTVDLGYPTEARGNVPSFSSIEEEAEFWDTHDTTEFGDWTPVEAIVSDRFRETLTVRLASSDIDALVELAEQEGTEPSTLAKRWIVEHIREAEAKAG